MSATGPQDDAENPAGAGANASSSTGAHSESPCLVCGRREIELFLDLGSTSLANKFLLPEELSEPESRFPLRVGFCHNCRHVQLLDRVPPPDMFNDYLYISSASETLKGHFTALSSDLIQRFGLGGDDLVIDVGCNDASLLTAFQKHGVRTLGVDPAENLAEYGEGIDRYTGFFGEHSAPAIADRWGSASLITATNTFPHIPDLAGFIGGLDVCLSPGGAFVVEAHYLIDILDQLAFDTVYHEHVSYWALGPMVRLFQRHGMEVVHAERLPIHHGQLRAIVQRRGEGQPDSSVSDLLDQEAERGLGSFETYRDFARRTDEIKSELSEMLEALRGQGKRVVGYGAPAKGSTLLEYLEVGTDQLEYIVDRSSLKQGRFTPGSHIPIVETERLLEDRPDVVLLLAWNFVDEVLEQQRAYVDGGGRFLLPVPTVRFVASSGNAE